MTAQIWATLVVAVIGVLGTLTAALLTQARAARLEGLRAVREQHRDEVRNEWERTREHERWLRDTRHEIYTDMVQASSAFFMSLPGAEKLADRCEDPDSQTYKDRSKFFDMLYRANFIAGPDLQAVIRQALDNTENAGHEPYFDDPPKQKEFEQSVFRLAYELTRRLEVAARAELKLPAPVQVDHEDE